MNTEIFAFIGKVDTAILSVRDMANETFQRLSASVSSGHLIDRNSVISTGIESAISTHATLGGNLATSAEGIVAALESATITHATLGGNLATTGDEVLSMLESTITTHATLGGNLATTAEGALKLVESVTSTHATLGGNLATTADNILSAVDESNVHDCSNSRKEYTGQFRTLILTMLGEFPRKGHLQSDFDDMFIVNYDKQISSSDMEEIKECMSSIVLDWTNDEFLRSSPEMMERIRNNLLRIAEMMDIQEKIPSDFSESDLEVVPHIALLNDFTKKLLEKIGGVPTCQDRGIFENDNILQAAKDIVANHRNRQSTLAYKMLRTAILENTAQARIQGLKLIASNFELENHPYLTSHDIVEEFHGRESKRDLKEFLDKSGTPILELEEALDRIQGEVAAFYASLKNSINTSILTV